MRIGEATIFLFLATCLHLAVWMQTGSVSSVSSPGNGGGEEVTMRAANPAQLAMMKVWQTPPDIHTQMTETPVVPMPSPVTPVAQTAPARPLKPTAMPPPQPLQSPGARQTPDLPALETAPAPLPALAAIRPQTRPPVAPEKQAARRDAQEPAEQARSNTTAKGATTQRHAAQTRTTGPSAASTARANALRAEWGASIHAKVRRHMRYPPRAQTAGTARLALRIAANGKLRDMRLTRSSGDALLDKAALLAVSRAGRFSRAPKGLPDGEHAFSLSLTFTR